MERLLQFVHDLGMIRWSVYILWQTLITQATRVIVQKLYVPDRLCFAKEFVVLMR